jgi:type IV secretion system protein VirB8
MAFFDELKNLKNRVKATSKGDALEVTRNWFTDRYETLQFQRSMLLVLMVVFSAAIFILSASITYIKSTRTIEPFVIEIEQKTGVPTVVDPVDVIIYSSDETIKKYFIWEFVKLREEYMPAYLDTAQKKLQVMSEGAVYGQYKSLIRTPDGPIAKAGKTGSISIQLKSYVPISDKAAQIRFKQTAVYSSGETVLSDKIVYLEFEFSNLELTVDQRYLNPLGFRVNKYRLEDEKI